MSRTLPVVAVILALALPVAASDSPWSVELRQSRHSSSAQMTFQVRFDADDLRRTPRCLAASLLAPFKSMDTGMRGILSSTRVDLYGVRFKPFKDLTRKRPGGARSSGIVAAAAPSEPARPFSRRRLDMTVYLRDAERNGKREARRWIISTLFDAALPSASGAPRWQKETVARDLVDMTRVWDGRL